MTGLIYIDSENSLNYSRQLIKELSLLKVDILTKDINLINEITSSNLDSQVTFAIFFCSSISSGTQRRHLEHLLKLEKQVNCSLYLLLTGDNEFKLHTLKGSKSNLFSSIKSVNNLTIISRLIYSTESNGLLSSIKFDDQIRREIEFPPKYRQAGINILSYFAEVLETKYPEMDSQVKITQQGTKVILEIETLDGYKKIAEEELEQYGQVLVGDLAPDEFMGGHNSTALENQLLLLSHQLTLQNRELQEYKNDEISNLRDDKKILLSLVERSLTANHLQIQDQTNIIRLQVESKDMSSELTRLLENSSSIPTEEVKEEILERFIEFRQNDKKGFNKFYTTCKNTLSKTALSFFVEIVAKMGASQL